MPAGGHCAHRGKGVLIIVASKGHPVKEFFLYLLYIRRGTLACKDFSLIPSLENPVFYKKLCTLSTGFSTSRWNMGKLLYTPSLP